MSGRDHPDDVDRVAGEFGIDPREARAWVAGGPGRPVPAVGVEELRSRIGVLRQRMDDAGRQDERVFQHAPDAARRSRQLPMPAALADAMRERLTLVAHPVDRVVLVRADDSDVDDDDLADGL